MNLAEVFAKMLRTLEGLIALTLLTSNRARKGAVLMGEHVALQLVLAVEELVREADTALEDLGRLASWWDRGDGGTDNLPGARSNL